MANQVNKFDITDALSRVNNLSIPFLLKMKHKRLAQMGMRNFTSRGLDYKYKGALHFVYNGF